MEESVAELSLTLQSKSFETSTLIPSEFPLDFRKIMRMFRTGYSLSLPGDRMQQIGICRLWFHLMTFLYSREKSRKISSNSSSEGAFSSG